MTDTTRTDLVLLHGWGMNAAIWPALPPPLAARLRPCALDLPGHGGRAFDPALVALPDWATDCLERAPERAIWLGWSLGGLVALQAALLAPERVQALILLSATPRFVQAVDWRAAMPEQTLAGFAGELLEDPSATLERFLALQVRGDSDARNTLRGLRAQLAERPAPDSHALEIGLGLLRDEDLRARLPDIRPPALWLLGERDTLVPAGVAERVALLMPGARVAVMPRAAHAPQLSHAGAVAEQIGAFLDEIAC
jgi:pimeloyl-[acyl-carrier protein] methyl ester esterase